jgi:hypothetical protein
VTRGAVFERTPDGVRVRLPAGTREALRELLPQLRGVLEGGDPSADPAVARLFPAAYPEDPLRSLEFETLVGPELLRGRLDAIRAMDASLDDEVLDDDRLLAWHATLNGLRLVLGTRLGITEETTEDDLPEEDHPAFELYRELSWLEGWLVEVLPLGA